MKLKSIMVVLAVYFSLLIPPALAGEIDVTSCLGVNSCAGNTGEIGPSVCNTENACPNNGDEI